MSWTIRIFIFITRCSFIGCIRCACELIDIRWTSTKCQGSSSNEILTRCFTLHVYCHRITLDWIVIHGLNLIQIEKWKRLTKRELLTDVFLDLISRIFVVHFHFHCYMYWKDRWLEEEFSNYSFTNVDRRSEISVCEWRPSRKTTLFTDVDENCFFRVLNQEKLKQSSSFLSLTIVSCLIPS